MVGAIKHAAKLLGNTPATCRKYYVHPLIPDIHRTGGIGPPMRRLLKEMPVEAEAGLHPKEAAVLGLLLGDDGEREAV